MHVYDITPSIAMQMLENDDVVMIDVRTQAEWNNGIPEIPEKVICLSLLIGAQMKPNVNFLDDFKILDLPLSTKIIFICKSGRRSREAASIISNIGYECYNLDGGFEAWKRTL